MHSQTLTLHQSKRIERIVKGRQAGLLVGRSVLTLLIATPGYTSSITRIIMKFSVYQGSSPGFKLGIVRLGKAGGKVNMVLNALHIENLPPRNLSSLSGPMSKFFVDKPRYMTILAASW